ncbi:UNVERIFIED_CONTAM: hypothetical protein GTU68_019944 [Idotea baltica]|nr:hypothetical protein [Idotea baltica]
MWVDEWSDEKNAEIFGKCANVNWHGHNYTLHITVKGQPDPFTGFIINAKELSELVKKVIVDKLDHKNLNLDVDFVPKNLQPTTENMVYLIWHELASHLGDVQLHRIQLWETDTIYAEYFGPTK